MFSSLGKKLKKTSEEGGNHSHFPDTPPLHLYVRRLKKMHLSLCDQMKKFV